MISNTEENLHISKVKMHSSRRQTMRQDMEQDRKRTALSSNELKLMKKLQDTKDRFIQTRDEDLQRWEGEVGE